MTSNMTDPASSGSTQLTTPPGTRPRPLAASMDVLKAWLGPLDGLHILDAGCGGGALAGALTKCGAVVTGIDPQEQAVEAARQRVPQARFEQAGAEDMPFPEKSFDAVVLLNSFHHVPLPLMRAALRESVRVSRGPVLIIEPLAEGPFFLCMQPIEDETEIRAAAQDTLTQAAASGDIQISATGEYDDARRFRDVDAFLARVVEVDPARADMARRARDTVAALMDRHATREGDKLALPQPHRAHLLTGIA